jgi:hypothetical protein
VTKNWQKSQNVCVMYVCVCACVWKWTNESLTNHFICKNPCPRHEAHVWVSFFVSVIGIVDCTVKLIIEPAKTGDKANPSMYYVFGRVGHPNFWKIMQGRWGRFLSQCCSCTNFWICQHGLGIGFFFLVPGWYWGFRVLKPV